MAANLQALVDGLQQPANGVTPWRDLDLHPKIARVTINDRVGLAGLAVDILRHISCIGMATVTQGATFHVDVEGVCAAWAVRGVRGEVLHYVALIVAGGAADGVEGGGGRDEVDSSARHLG